MQPTYCSILCKVVLWDGDVVVGDFMWYPFPLFCSPEDAVQVREIFKDIIPLLIPVSKGPVPQLRTLPRESGTHIIDIDEKKLLVLIIVLRLVIKRMSHPSSKHSGQLTISITIKDYTYCTCIN